MSPTLTARLASLLVALVLSPFVAHALWRPTAVELGSPTEGVAFGISIAALAVVAISGGWILSGRGGRGGPVGGLGILLVGAGVGWAIAGAAGAACLVGVGLGTIVALPRMIASLAAVMEEMPSQPSRLAVAIWGLAILGLVALSVDLATYLGDPWAEGRGAGQGTHIYRHLCFTAYLHAAELLEAGLPNVYDLSRIPPPDSGLLPDTAAHMAPFTLDRYGYPPQFLLLPLGLVAVVSDFAAQRAAWACLNTLLVAAALWRIGLWVGPRSGRVFRWLGPFLWGLGAPVFQSGNVQLTVLTVGVLAMMAFDRRRERAGGAMLAGVILAKIAPGLLGVLLLVQRRWRGVGWTVAFAGLFTALTLAVTGPEVFVDFVTYHLPRIASGEAYDFLDDSAGVITYNLSPFGLPFKLGLLGVSLDPWAWGPRFVNVYTALAFALTILAGRRSLDRRGQVAVWMLVLTMAGLRSPMAPGYLMAGVFIAMALYAAEVTDWRGWVKLIALFALLQGSSPLLPSTPGSALLSQAVMHGVVIWLMLRRWEALDPALHPHPLGGAGGGARPPSGPFPRHRAAK